MEDVRKIKGLQSQIKAYKADADLLKSLLSNTQKEFNQKQKKIQELEELVKSLTDIKNLNVSEHAIVRYFERVRKEDIEAIKKEILNDSVRSLVSVLGGNGTFPFNENFSVVIKNFTVTTIVV